MECRVKITGTFPERVVSVPSGSSLANAVRLSGIGMAFPCGGSGVCGKCRVSASGKLSEMTPREKELLSGAPSGTRLACFAKVQGDCEIFCPAGIVSVETDFICRPYTPCPSFDGDHGAVFDIGTTTVAAYLLRRGDPTPIQSAGYANAQAPYGADVISRIEWSNTHGVSALCSAVRKQISDMLLELCRRSDISPDRVGGLTVTGNTVMMHLLTGLDPRSLAAAPFTPLSLFGSEYDLDIYGFPGLKAFIPRCISAYVGADTVCAVLASGMTEHTETSLLIDIGTNGEIALFSNGTLACCSAAAGPALEGAGISCGSHASCGAICSVKATSGAYECKTVGDAPASGICGSGIIDAAAAMLHTGDIDRSGRMKKERVFLAPDVFISQADVRALQLAKAAIRAGIDTLLAENGIKSADVTRVILCGGFGVHIDTSSAAAIGLIPPEFADRTEMIGNAAAAGASAVLQSTEMAHLAAETAKRAVYTELSGNPYFMDRFISSMSF